MLRTRFFAAAILLLLTLPRALDAQPDLRKDFSYIMEIPSLVAIESSPAHVYALSETEGMVVFRAHADSLQWLYSSAGMEQRGNRLTADIRFAYLFGGDSRLTVLEPTSVLGVYSSTRLPAPPVDAVRLDQRLYLALDNGEMGWLSLRTSAAVDSAFTPVASGLTGEERIIDLEGSGNRLLALSASGTLYRFTGSDGELEEAGSHALESELEHIFLFDRTLMGTDPEGAIHEIGASGELSLMGSIDEPVEKMELWRDRWIIQGETGRLWTSYNSRSPQLWKGDTEAGYFFTSVDNQLWLSEYGQVSRVVPAPAAAEGDTVRPAGRGGELPSTLTLSEVPDQLVPHSKPVILSLGLREDFPPGEVQYAYRSSVENAQIRGSGFHWQPSSGEVGTHEFRIIATSSNGLADSTRFSVEVNSFNAPPRFAPLRPISIPAGEPFTLPIRAIDPDGMHRDLIRYMGVDLPEGASVDEKSGELRWTPAARQTGEHSFRVIATDQYGAASSADVTITVVDPVDDGGN